ncbi:hypothetical protein POM88_045520 [Heracleum sosnowskyi]|uniref:WAT1-related protein n=1 Tax=Heracleum sosnowskyi TaxID=360622 RepID=A0AAD8H740_9APIA|nr:hypothetical protein POM88_045520 [Heracleum sosnowskyi]
MDWKKGFMESRVVMGMLAVQGFAVGLQILSRIILTQGTFIFALMTYRQIVGAICVAPLAFYHDRCHFKKLTWLACFWLFMVALTGISMAMGLYYYGLRDTTATYATNFLNLIPIVTFIFSTILRIENLGLHSGVGKIKTMGAMLCLAGALTVSLYKGPAVISHHNAHPLIVTKAKTNYLSGTMFLVASVLSYGLWFISQVKLFKVFPCKYMSTMLICIIAAVQQVVIGLCIDHSKSSWSLGFNLNLVTIVYSGALSTAATFCLVSWAVAERGPTYPSMFNPLALITVAVVEALFMSEELKLGSLVGMLLIILGLYAFLWAKKKESKNMKQALQETAASTQLPVTIGSINNKKKNDKNSTAHQSAKTQSSSTVTPTTSPPNDHADDTVADTVEITL